MPATRKSKDLYTASQKRKARHIEESYEQKGVSESTAKARAWATVNKQSGGGERKGGSGARTSPATKAAARQDSARQAVATRHGVPRNDQPLETRTRVDLMQLARGLKIAGRSSMNKQQLIQALKQAS